MIAVALLALSLAAQPPDAALPAALPPAQPAAAATIGAPAEAPAAQTNFFAIKADRNLARRINAVLAEFGAPLEARLPEGQSANGYLRERCRFAPPTASVVESDPTGRTIRHAPCLLAIPNVEVTVRQGDSLPLFGARMGLLPGSVGELKVRKVSKLPRPTSTTLLPNDKVTAPDAPTWTSLRVDAARLPNRDAFVSAVAGTLECGIDAPEACLQRFNVKVIDNKPRTLISTTPPPALRPGPSPGAALRDSSVRASMAAQSALDHARAAAQDDTLPPAPSRSPVAPGQWPYDRDLVGRILKGAATTNVLRTPVAVIDVGLRDASGGPMPSYVYPDKDPESDDAFRQFGDGPPFTQGKASSVAICPDQSVDIPSLMAEQTRREAFSHGAVTGSLAAGVPLHVQDGIPTKVLPQLVFLRLYQAPCPPTGEATVQPLDLIQAFESVYASLDIIVIGRQASQRNVPGLASALAPGLIPNKLLVVPAGNDGPGNLDEAVGQYCPACLANREYDAHGGAIHQRVLAVGAANENLEVEPFSNYGPKTVAIYAAGKPTGALDLDGKDASDLKPATSYAAPNVAMAAALARTLAPGVDLERIVQRLRIAVWPLMKDGKPLPTGGVLDLTKVVAINYYSVEAWSTPPGADRAVLRTYVGKLTQRLASYQICPGQGFAADQYQGLVLGEPGLGGWRSVTAFPQRYAQRSYVPLLVQACNPTGDLEIVDIRDGLQKVPWATITRVLPPLVR